MSAYRRKRGISLKATAVALASLFLFNSIAAALPHGSTLATLPAGENPIVKREILAALQRTRIVVARDPEDIGLLGANNTSCLLLPSGKYLLTDEVSKNDLLLLRNIIHEDIEAIMQVMAANNRYGYQAIKELVLKHFPPEKDNNLPIDLYVNHTVARAFEWIILLYDKVVLEGEMQDEERSFVKKFSKTVAIRRGYFTAEFWDSRARSEKIKAAANSGMRFYRAANSPKPSEILRSFDRLPPNDKLYLSSSNRTYMKTLGYTIMAMVVEYLATLNQSKPYDGAAFQHLTRLVNESYPNLDNPRPIGDVIEFVQHLMDYNMRFNDRYIGHMLTTPVAIAALVNVFDHMNIDMSDPNAPQAAQYIENITIEWLAQIIGYKDSVLPSGDRIMPGGIIVSGGTIANLSAFLMARNRALSLLGEDVTGKILLNRRLKKDMVIFASKESHYSVKKLAGYIGMGSDNIINVDIDENFRMDTEDLRAKIAAAKRDGKIAVAIVAAAATTEVGSVDPLEEIADIAEREKIWFHVDGAYGAPFMLSQKPNVRRALKGIERADSVTFDPHKMLYIPYNCGAVLVKNKESLSFIKRVSLADRQASKSTLGRRRFDALKVWAVLKWMGAKNMSGLVDHTIDMARYLHDLVAADPDFELINHPDTNIFTFRYVPPHINSKLSDAMARHDEQAICHLTDGLNDLNKKLQQAIQAGGETWVSSTDMENSKYTPYLATLPGERRHVKAMRVVIMNPFVSPSSLRKCFEVIRKTAAEIIPGTLRLKTITHAIPPAVGIEDEDYEFRRYFVSPLNMGQIGSMAREMVDIVLSPSSGRTLSLKDQKEFFGDHALPKNAGNTRSVLNALKALHDSVGNIESKSPPFIASLASVVYQALNPNNIAQEVSPMSTAVEARLVSLLTEMVGYRTYDRPVALACVGQITQSHESDMSETQREVIEPGGIITNGLHTSLLTTLLVARNVRLKEVLRNSNDVDITETGLMQASGKLTQLADLVIITSESQAPAMRDMAGIIGIGSDNVIAVREKDGNTNPNALHAMIKEAKERGKTIMMVNVYISNPSKADFKRLKKMVGQEAKYSWLNTTLGGNAGRILLNPSMFPEAGKYIKYGEHSKLESPSAQRKQDVREDISLLSPKVSCVIDMCDVFSMPPGIGVALFKSQRLLKEYLKQSAPYILKKLESDESDDMINISAYSVEGSKGFQALELWLALLLTGEKKLLEAVVERRMESEEKTARSGRSLFESVVRDYSYIAALIATRVEKQLAAAVPQGARVLDLASGYNTYVPDSIKAKEVVGVGLNKKELEGNRRLTAHIEQDLNNNPELPLPANHYDAVTIISGMAYIDNPKRIFAAAGKHLKTGGVLFIVFGSEYYESEASQIWKTMNGEERVAYVIGEISECGLFENIQVVDLETHIVETPLSHNMLIIATKKDPAAPVRKAPGGSVLRGAECLGRYFAGKKSFTKKEFQNMRRRMKDPHSDTTVYSELAGLVALRIIEVRDRGKNPYEYVWASAFERAPPGTRKQTLKQMITKLKEANLPARPGADRLAAFVPAAHEIPESMAPQELQGILEAGKKKFTAQSYGWGKDLRGQLSELRLGVADIGDILYPAISLWSPQLQGFDCQTASRWLAQEMIKHGMASSVVSGESLLWNPEYAVRLDSNGHLYSVVPGGQTLEEAPYIDGIKSYNIDILGYALQLRQIEGIPCNGLLPMAWHVIDDCRSINTAGGVRLIFDYSETAKERVARIRDVEFKLVLRFLESGRIRSEANIGIIIKPYRFKDLHNAVKELKNPGDVLTAVSRIPSARVNCHVDDWPDKFTGYLENEKEILYHLISKLDPYWILANSIGNFSCFDSGDDHKNPALRDLLARLPGELFNDAPAADILNSMLDAAERRDARRAAGGKWAFVFSEGITFNHGLGYILPAIAQKGAKVAVVVSRDARQADYERAFVAELNAELKKRGLSDDKYIQCIDRVEGASARLGVARCYYFKIDGEKDDFMETIGVTVINIAAAKVGLILDAIGRVCRMPVQKSSELELLRKEFVDIAA